MPNEYLQKSDTILPVVGVDKPGKQRRRLAAAALLGLGVVAEFSRMLDHGGTREYEPEILTFLKYGIKVQEDKKKTQSSLKVMTLNAAHGRKRGSHQLFQKRSSIKANLRDIASVFKRERPDLVALQEADGPSIWSGSFDHVRYLAEEAEYLYSVRGEHVRRARNSYGTAFLSNLPLNTPVSITFAPAPPIFSKGAVISTIAWPGNPEIAVDVVSVHLDCARKSVRQKQVEEMKNKLDRRERPVIIMGDLNCDWNSREMTLQYLIEGLKLKAYQPWSNGLDTFPRWGRRLDWILVSSELEFSNYTVFNDVVSDHFGVSAELVLV